MNGITSWVDVYINGEIALSIGDNYLSGRELTEEDEIIVRECAKRLLSFIGSGYTSDNELEY